MMKKILPVFAAFFLFCTLTACHSQQETAPEGIEVQDTPTVATEIPTLTPTTTPVPPRVLTICSEEPGSLSLYQDTSSAARSVLQAIYDGPVDMVNFALSAVILEKIPSLENGDVLLQPLEVRTGDLIMDAQGKWVSLEQGVTYLPSGCLDASCALVYEGPDPVQMDSLVARFRLLSGLRWSDGEALTAADSVYAFEIFKAMFAKTFPEVLRVTLSYLALDDLTVEWHGIPGYLGEASTRFFSPLPEHQGGGLDLDTLLSSELFNRKPMGWGPYVIDEWVDGDHISLSRNPNYYRAAEGLPYFDHLVFRFMADGNEGIDALLAGECDLVDRTLLFEEHIPRLQAEQAAGRIVFNVQPGTAWELAAFGIQSLRQDQPAFFNPVEVRRAAAMCIDRRKILDELLFGIPALQNTYVPPNHPLQNTEVDVYEYNPERAAGILDTAGWLDLDGDPQTPRTAVGVAGIPDGTPFSFTYLVPSDGERPRAAQIIQSGLASCGIKAEIVVEDWETLMQPGPEGLLFGRQFQMAQFAWTASLEPACTLFTSSEIPGPYPEYPKGWGGGNLSGYSSADLDAACARALHSIPGSEAYLQAHRQAQAIFATDLPVLPLYQRIRLVAARPDLCSLAVDPSANSALSHLEVLDYGLSCSAE